MRAVSVREARTHLARILAEVIAGHEVAVTRRGQEVARIVPARPAGRPLPSRTGIRQAMCERGAVAGDSTVVAMRREERW